MRSYFDRFEQQLSDAVERRARRPWYRRLPSTGRSRGVAVVLAGLVIAAPAVGAVTDWYGIGAPDHATKQLAGIGAGRALAGTSELPPLRVADPQGGPAWGLRIVHTTRGDTCIQLGRVEDGRLGSLGIDGAWHDDHLFHAFPKGSQGSDCGTTDADGDGFVNVVRTGVVANANSPASGIRGTSCRSPALWVGRFAGRGSSDALIGILRRRLQRLRGHSGDRVLIARLQRQLRHVESRPAQNQRRCPTGSVRIVFMGLLGPDARSITYEAPDHSIRTERTSGSDGAYLLVFPLSVSTCETYTQGPTGAYGPCGGTESVGGASPDTIGAVKAISYRDGHVCRLGRASAAWLDFSRWLAAYARAHHIRNGHQTTSQHGAERRAAFEYLAAHHIRRGQLRPPAATDCPAVGYVASKATPVTAAMVSTPIAVRVLSYTASGPEVVVSFTAREPVTSSSSWYEDAINGPRGCGGESAGEIGYGNVHVGQRLHDSEFVTACKGVYHGVVGYMQNGGPINEANSGGGTPGLDGSVVVGRFSFRVR